MTQERVKCPFCSELILPGAMKCRFCGEWFSKEEEVVGNSGRPEDYGGPTGGGYERDPMEHRSPREHAIPIPNIKEQSEKADNDHKDEHPQAVKESPVRVVRYAPGEDRRKSRLRKKSNRIPWLRMILAVGYLGIAAAMGIYEFKAHRALRDAQAKENAQDQSAAFNAYRDMLEKFPFSFATIETRQGLRRLSDSHEDFGMPKPSWMLPIEDMLGELTVSDVYLLPLLAWPACAVMLALVSLTRIFRPVAALLSLLFMLVAVAGSVAQLSWYGLVPLGPATEAVQSVMQVPVSVYCSTYALLLITVSMSLTAAAKRSRQHTSGDN